MAKRKVPSPDALVPTADYDGLLGEVVVLLESARRTAARAVNAVMTATYWEIGRRIVEVEQRGSPQAEYGDVLMKRLAADLTARFGRGFSCAQSVPDASLPPGLRRHFADTVCKIGSATLDPASPHRPPGKGILQTLSAKSQTTQPVGLVTISDLAARFPLPWSHYVRLLAVKKDDARRFYEQEALRGGWSTRQLDRQIGSQFYERTLLSRNKAAMLRKGSVPQPGDLLTPEEEIKDPLVLEFLNLKDEYSEHDLEEALIRKLEDFLLELGGDFAFMGRQKRLRIGDEWYRIDLLFFHRRLHCLVVIDLKIGKFTPADSGQMHLYLNYAREHWTHEGENPPVGLILCARRTSRSPTMHSKVWPARSWRPSTGSLCPTSSFSSRSWSGPSAPSNCGGWPIIPPGNQGPRPRNHPGQRRGRRGDDRCPSTRSTSPTRSATSY